MEYDDKPSLPPPLCIIEFFLQLCSYIYSKKTNTGTTEFKISIRSNGNEENGNSYGRPME